MIFLEDTPLQAPRMTPLRSLRWGSLFVAISILSGFAWGSSFIHVGDIKGLEIQAEFLGYQRINQKGEFTYTTGESLVYRVRLKNRSNVSFANIEVQSSLHSDGASCQSKELIPGSRLPGASLSPVHNASVSTGRSVTYDAIYSVPSDLCPSSAHLRVRLQYRFRNRLKATTLTCPAHIRFE